MSLEKVDKEYIGQVLLSKGFETWFLYMFRAINGRPFIYEAVHKDLFQLFQDIHDQKILRHNLNIPPRSAKTTCCEYFIAYSYAINPKCNFIYTSYSQSLLADIANAIINILEHPIYKQMYPQVNFEAKDEYTSPIDDVWREYWQANDKEKKNIYTSKKIITYAGGLCWFASLGSQLTGVGAGIRGAKTFSGGIICFPYEQEILTNKGKKKIGEIVENKESVLILSYDFDKNKAEYMPIDRYIKNSGKFNCVTVHLKNGESFKCTDNHKIYTLNRGWVEAAFLNDKDIVKTCSNSFKLFKCYIKLFTKLFTFDIPISYSLQRFVRKFPSFINNLSGEILKTSFSFNGLNRSSSTSRKNFTFFGNYITFIRNHIIFKFGYSFVDSVVFNNHIYNSYCVTVHKNHNLFVGENQYILASNCDDSDKPSDIHSEVMREKTHKYFSETLLSRLNDSSAFILNVQQRVHVEDMTGYLSEVYGYKSLVKPLFVDGVCQIPSQYTQERIEEIKKDYNTFSAQYQQEPVPEQGLLIHTDKFVEYETPPEKFDLLYICCDTAFSEKKSADNSAFMLMGIVGEKRYILDVYCKKVDFVGLRRDLKMFYEKALAQYGQLNNFSSIYIEAKASGISLIQQLRSEGLPIAEIYPTIHNAEAKKDEVKDKYTRFLEVQADIESGYVYIPREAVWKKEFIKECLAFTGGKQNYHDDVADSFIYCLKVARKYKQPDWEAFKRAFR